MGRINLRGLFRVSRDKVHRLLVPCAHAWLWIMGLVLTLYAGSMVRNELVGTFGVTSVFVVFLAELAITFFDLYTFEGVKSWKPLPLVFGTALLLVITTVVSLLSYVYLVAYENSCQMWLVWTAVTATAGLKFLEIWLPNNVGSQQKTAVAATATRGPVMWPKELK